MRLTMKPRLRKPSLVLVLIIALVALLPGLAALQYRWLGEVSRGDRERMQANLLTAVSNFSQDFDREITRAYIVLQMGGATLHHKGWQDYARRYNYWTEKSPYPQLISDLYLVDAGQDAQIKLAHFNRASSQFEPAGWPQEIS